jgi:hypothetical protein
MAEIILIMKIFAIILARPLIPLMSFYEKFLDAIEIIII